MALTPRQRQFYEALMALCASGERSVHYSAVAHALGVSPFSAYDMLKLLESKGAVGSEYVLAAPMPGPGRSAIMFYPRPTCPEPAAMAGAEEAEWSRVRQRLLQRLAEVRDGNVWDVLSDILGRLSEYSSPLHYCTGVVAALLVNLRASGQGLFYGQLQAVQGLFAASELGLGTLAGLSIGSNLEHLAGTPTLEPLVNSVRRLQTHVAALSGESRQRLAGFLREALLAMEAHQA